MPDLTKLDAPSLRTFAETDVREAGDEIARLRTSDQEGQSLYDISNAPNGPFFIGPMAGDSDTAGKSLVSHTIQSAKAIDSVLNRHLTAFRDLRRQLDDVVDTMLKTQGETLQQVDGQKFLSAIRGYDADMSGGTYSSSSSTSSG
ncbi:type VII secretion system-associated protein [Streptomyces sp. NBC_01176]|uniref:type VII secretion system-associated protein n=1 Tax=Streptomyces sp. NBC_01176 TaxID=2903760 RepID=UPI002F906B77|nr:type VII secretion system-associated protein [Streptomyces sp. NBC_01176]